MPRVKLLLDRFLMLRCFGQESGFSGMLTLAITLSIGLVAATVYSSAIAPHLQIANTLIDTLPAIGKATDDTATILDCSMGEHLVYQDPTVDYNLYRNQLKQIYDEIKLTLPDDFDICLGIIGRSDPTSAVYGWVEREDPQSTETYTAYTLPPPTGHPGNYRYLYGCDSKATGMDEVIRQLAISATFACIQSQATLPSGQINCNLKDIYIVGISYRYNFFKTIVYPDSLNPVFIAPSCDR